MAQIKEVSREKVQDYLEGMAGKMISVDWKTKDGYWRTLNGRLGVTKYSHGGINREGGGDVRLQKG